MKLLTTMLLCAAAALPASAQLGSDRRSLLDSEPDVIYLQDVVEQPIKLKVIKDAPVFSDKEGNHRLGYLKANQIVDLEGMTEKVYRVRGEGTRNGIAGWVAPWAFSHPQEDFVEKLKQVYSRQISVNQIISAGGVALGMTMVETGQSRGTPTKTSMRRTKDGQSGTWEYIDYDEVKHYVTRIDPLSGGVFRQLSHITREETGKTVVEFQDNIVSAIEESENNQFGGVRVVVPPLFFGL